MYEGEARTAAVLRDPDTAPISPGLRATLAFLAKVTLTPDALGPDDAAQARAAGVSDEALDDALHVAFLFAVYTRLADAMGWEQLDERERAGSASRLFRKGYA